MWKPEYSERRRRRAAEDPEYRAKRNAQGAAPDKIKRAEYMRDWFDRNREHIAEYRRANAERRNARRRERYAEDAEYRERAKARARARDPDAKRDARLRATFGISANDYDRLYAEQSGGCAICGIGIGDGTGRRLYVDHCHDTGAVRGLLCSACNFGLGKFRDNVGLLRKAIKYLLERPR